MFKKNDRVKLTTAVEGFGVGAEGFVRHIDRSGNLIVNLDKDVDGTAFDPPQPLLPHEPENFVDERSGIVSHPDYKPPQGHR